MQGSPPGLDVAAVERVVRRVEGVRGVHDLHVWRVSDGFDVVTVHVVVDDAAVGTEVSRKVTSALRHDLGIAHAKVQPEAQPDPRTPDHVS